VVGIRLGHHSETFIDEKNPIFFKFAFSKKVKGLSFQIIDIDGGDAFMVHGYNNGIKLTPKLFNISDNYFQQYSTLTNWLFGDQSSDAGGTEYIPSSLDMGATVCFEEALDSVVIKYQDFSPSTSGTFTLGNITARKFNHAPVECSRPQVFEQIGKGLQIKWQMQNSQYAKSYKVLRSYDSRSFETIYKNSTDANTDFTYFDSEASANAAVVFYKIAFEESDNNIGESPVIRFKRLLSQSLLGFKAINGNFLDEVDLVLLKDMPGQIQINMYDYGSKKVKTWEFEDKKRDSRILLKGLNSLPASIYYLEMVNNGQKYLFEVSNNNGTSRLTLK
jgi:hypothetical protein